ncbi:hypothetical protein [Candidatus Pristimantibacillus sp. PTI5]|uniref:hypothetical protein n=1 Tax=Candidatus Pristimantibacillus sp. PTI5 TaxID=3400422 RepID=UPI003B02B76D
MKRGIMLLVTLFMAASILGCAQDESEPLTKEQFRAMYEKVNKFKGRTVEIYGEIFATPQRLEKMVYIQLYADPINREQSVIVAFKDPGLDVQNGDYVYVAGKVKDAFTGENTFGSKLSVPRIIAETVRKIDPATALSPPSRSKLTSEAGS